MTRRLARYETGHHPGSAGAETPRQAAEPEQRLNSFITGSKE